MNKSISLYNSKDRKLILKLSIPQSATSATDEMHMCSNHTKLTRPELNSGAIKIREQVA